MIVSVALQDVLQSNDDKKYLLVSKDLVAVLRVERSTIIIHILWKANWDNKKTEFNEFKLEIIGSTQNATIAHIVILYWFIDFQDI